MSGEHGNHISEQAVSDTVADEQPGYVAAAAFQRDLYLYWREVAESRGLPLTPRGFVARPGLRRVRAVLIAASGGEVSERDNAESEDLRLLFLRRLAQRLGLLDVTDGKLTASERHVMARYLTYPAEERLRICVRVWSAGGWWQDAPDSAALPRLMAPAPPRLALARRRLMDDLRQQTPGACVPLPARDSVSAPKRHSSGATRPRRAVHGKATMDDSEGLTRLAALTGPLAWLGLVTLDTLPDTSVRSACVTAAATAALTLDVAPPVRDIEAAGRIVVQSNFEIIAYPPLTAPALLLLDTCAERAAIDVTARYRLTRASFARARTDGWTAQDIAARLSALAGASLPANLRVSLDDWERHVERVTLTDQVSVLEMSDPALLDALLADRACAGWIERRLTPTAALLVDGSAGHVRAWLLRHGEIPAMRGMKGGSAS